MPRARTVRHSSIIRHSDERDIELRRVRDQWSPHERRNMHIPRPRHRATADLGITHLITSRGKARLDEDYLVTVSPVTVASVLWANRIPYTPSVDFSLPSMTSVDLS